MTTLLGGSSSCSGSVKLVKPTNNRCNFIQNSVHSSKLIQKTGLLMLKKIITPIFLTLAIYLGHLGTVSGEPIYHEKAYPAGSGPFPAVIALHTAGGIKRFKHIIQRFVGDGFAVYAPDYFTRHDITARTRMFAFSSNREEIENDLLEIINLMKGDPKVDKNNIFSAGYSAGGFYVCFLSSKGMVNAGVSLYGVWSGPPDWEMESYPVEYLSESSTPILALHGEDDQTQKLFRVEKAWNEAKDNGAPLEIHVYSNADHAWDRKGSKKWPYNEQVDKSSHKRTIAFFKKHMK